MTQLVIFGECLVDFITDDGARLQDTTRLRPSVGGAPANVAVQLARLGWSADRLQFASATGDDAWGHWLRTRLAQEGVGVDAVLCKEAFKTGITFIDIDDAGERSFHPYRERAADLAVSVDDLPQRLLSTTTWLHTGTVSMRTPSSMEATQVARQQVREAGGTLSLDVNLRPRMFPSQEELLHKARSSIQGVDVVKLSRDEGEVLFGTRDAGAIADAVLQMGPQMVAVTLDDAGALLATTSTRVSVDAVPVAHVVDATGAGDAFMGGLLSVVAPLSTDDVDDDVLHNAGALACRLGAAVVQHKGATTGMLQADQL